MALASTTTTDLKHSSTIVRSALNRVCQFDIGTPEDAAAFLRNFATISRPNRERGPNPGNNAGQRASNIYRHGIGTTY